MCVSVCIRFYGETLAHTQIKTLPRAFFMILNEKKNKTDCVSGKYQWCCLGEKASICFLEQLREECSQPRANREWIYSLETENKRYLAPFNKTVPLQKRSDTGTLGFSRYRIAASQNFGLLFTNGNYLIKPSCIL